MKFSKKMMIFLMGLPLSGSFLYASQQIVRSDFFKDIVGFDESFFRNRYGFKPHGKDSFGVLSKIDMRKINGWMNRRPGKGVAPHRRRAIFEGDFSVPTVSDLKKRRSSSGRGSFTFLLHDPNNPQKTDIRALQANPANNGAAFQLASTFFGPLEGGVYKWQSKVANMLGSPVQGEEASISAAPATIYRKYFMALDSRHKIFKDNKFYLLYALKNKLPMKFGPGGGPYVSADNYQFSLGDKDKVAVGVHHNILVTSGYGGSGKGGKQQRLSTMRNLQRITQIFTSAYDTRFSRGHGCFKPLSQPVKDASRMLLKGAYEGTIRAAASKGIKRIYLTLIGGGSFRNDIRWIGEAILDMQNFIKNSGMEVILIYRPDKPRPQDKIQLRTANKDIQFLKDMCRMADYINGTNNCQSVAGLIQQYISPFYNGGSKMSSFQIGQLQQKLNRKGHRPSRPRRSSRSFCPPR